MELSGRLSVQCLPNVVQQVNSIIAVLANKTGFFTDLLIFILDLQGKVYCQQTDIKDSRISTLEHQTYFGNTRLVETLDLKYKWRLIFIGFLQ